MRITLPSGTPAEIARPNGDEAPTMGLVMWPDIMGLRPLFDEHCRRIADQQNWVVVCPEVFPGQEDLPIEERLQLVGTLSEDRFLTDGVDAADVTEQARVGVMGFCMGGTVAMKCSGTGRFDAAASFYGMIRTPPQWAGPGVHDALDFVSRPEACPLIAVIGTADEWVPAADVEALEQTGAMIVRYDGAEHGFVHDPSRPAHRASDALDAWKEP